MGGVAGLVLGSLLNNNNGGLFGGNNNGGAATAAVATDIVLNPAFQSLQQQITTLSGQTANNGLHAQIEHESQEITTGLDRLDNQLTQGQAEINQNIANVAAAQQSANFTTLNSINGLGRDFVAQTNQNALQNLNSFNQLNTSTLQGFNQAAADVMDSYVITESEIVNLLK